MPFLSVRHKANLCVGFLLTTMLCQSAVAQDAPRIAPITDNNIQRMALEMESADCDTLLSLDNHTKYTFLLAIMYLQREGSLSRIVGPDCAFLGDTEEIAAIDDDTLTISSDREILYFVPLFDVLLVSHTGRNAIAYGMFIEGNGTPLNYFLNSRDEAARSAAIARSFRNTVGTIEPPVFVPFEQQQRVSQASATSVSSAATTSAAERMPSSEAPEQQQQFGTSSVAQISNSEDDTPPPFSAPGTTTEEESVSAGTASGELPTIRPIGPEPEPTSSDGRGAGYWALMGFFAIVLIGVGVVILKTRVSKEQAYEDS